MFQIYKSANISKITKFGKLGVEYSVENPDPESGAFLTPGSGIQDPGWVKNRNPDPGWTLGSYFRELKNIFQLKILKFFDADPGSGMEKIRIRDPG